jgi:hypothetical protein
LAAIALPMIPSPTISIVLVVDPVQQIEQGAPVEVTRAGLAAARRVGDLDVAEPVGPALDELLDRLAHAGEVVEVGEERDVGYVVDDPEVLPYRAFSTVHPSEAAKPTATSMFAWNRSLSAARESSPRSPAAMFPASKFRLTSRVSGGRCYGRGSTWCAPSARR